MWENRMQAQLYPLNISLERGKIMLIEQAVVTAKSYSILSGLIKQV